MKKSIDHYNIDNDVISDGASDDASSNSQESNRSSLVDDHSDDSDDENCSFESKLQLDGFDIYHSFLRLSSNKFKRFFNSYSKDTKTPLRDMKPYAPELFGSHPASIPVDEND